MSAPVHPTNRPEGWVRGCTGKQPFESHRQANRRAKIMRQKKGLPMMAYHCKHCRHFHVGTDDRYATRRERAERRNQREDD